MFTVTILLEEKDLPPQTIYDVVDAAEVSGMVQVMLATGGRKTVRGRLLGGSGPHRVYVQSYGKIDKIDTELSMTMPNGVVVVDSQRFDSGVVRRTQALSEANAA